MLDVAMVGLGSWARRMVDSVKGKSTTIHFASAYSRTPAKFEPYYIEQGIRASDDLAAVVGDRAIGGVVVCSAAGVHAGDLGRILHAEGNFCVNRYANMKPGNWKSDASQIPPGGMADHMLYTMIELMGPVAEVAVQGLRQVIELDIADSSSAMLRFAGGASGLLTAIGVTRDFNRLHLFGSHGWAEIRGNTHFEFKLQDGDSVVTDLPPFNALKCELESFAAAGGATAYPVSPAAVIDGVAAPEAMFKSGASGKPVII